MMLGHILKALAPILATVMAAGVAGCDGSNVTIGGEQGKRLAELDLTGPAPNELVLLGPDEVQVTQGDSLAITVDGDPDAAAAMRFTLKNGTLSILRADKLFSGDGKRAVVHVTMPAPKEVTMAGSGKISAPVLAPDAKVTIAGSGRIDTQNVSGDKLDVTLPGSGSFSAKGAVANLELTILGSGSAELAGVTAGKAKVTIAGSGGAAFASDGDVDATIMGSGSVKVTGRARCKVSAMGSGELVCEAGVTKTGMTETGGDSSEAPAATPTPE